MLEYVVLANPGRPKRRRSKKRSSGAKRKSARRPRRAKRSRPMARRRRRSSRRRTPPRGAGGRFMKRSNARRGRSRKRRRNPAGKAAVFGNLKRPRRKFSKRRKAAVVARGYGRRSRHGRVALNRPKRRRRRNPAGKGRKKSFRRAGPRTKRRLWALGYASRRRRGGRYRYALNRPRRRRRSNPGFSGGIVGGIKAAFGRLAKAETWKSAVAGAAGLGGALYLPVAVARLSGKPQINQGVLGIAASVVSAGILYMAARSLRLRSADKVLAGGLVAAGAKLASAVLPSQYKYLLPVDEISRASLALPGGFSAAPAAAAPGGRAGMNDYLTLNGPSPVLTVDAITRRGMGDYMAAGGGMQEFSSANAGASAAIF